MFDTVITPWHNSLPIDIVQLGLSRNDLIGENGIVFRTSHPSTNTSAIAKLMPTPSLMTYTKNETGIYKVLDGKGITPHFHGHIWENGRIVGLLLEDVEHRKPTRDDMGQCRAAIGRLHTDFTIVHCAIHTDNMLITDRGVLLIDFERSMETDDAKARELDLEQLRRAFD